MKVLLITENWEPGVGGIERYLKGIVEHLGNYCDVTVIASDKTPFSDKQERYNLIRKNFFVGWPKPKWLFFFLYVLRKAKKEKWQVVLCGKALFEGLVGYYLKKILGVPYVVFTYAMEIEKWKSDKRARKKLEMVLGGASRIVYINEVTKKSIIGLGIEENKMIKITPAVDDFFLKEVNREEVEKAKSSLGLQGKEYILTVGRLIKRKGVDVLIKTFADTEGFIKLLIVGSGPEEKNLKVLVKNLQVEDRVIFAGEVPDERLAALYRGCVFFALTPKDIKNDFEGFGIVYLEAAAQERACLATESGGIGEAVKNNETGIVVEASSVKNVKEALIYLINNREKIASWGKEGRKRVMREFTWEKKSEQVKSIFKKVGE